jgi:ribosomal-protein-alanine N-acetyltransferase
MNIGVEARTDTAVTWRPMREEDLPAIAALEQASHAAPWTQGNFRDAFNAGYGTLVAEIDGGIAGYGVLSLAPGEAQLLNLTVATAVRRRGLGRQLLHRLLADAVSVGAEQCFLEVRESNHAAIALYLREGFAPVARRAGYYPPPASASRREDALVMQRRLGRHSDG